MKTIIGIIVIIVVGLAIWKLSPTGEAPTQVPATTSETSGGAMMEDGTIESGAMMEATVDGSVEATSY